MAPQAVRDAPQTAPQVAPPTIRNYAGAIRLGTTPTEGLPIFATDERISVVILNGKWSFTLICPVGFGVNEDGSAETFTPFLEECTQEGKFVPVTSSKKKTETPSRLEKMFGSNCVVSVVNRALTLTITASGNAVIDPFPCTSFDVPDRVKLMRFRLEWKNVEVISNPFMVINTNTKGCSKYYDEGCKTLKDVAQWKPKRQASIKAVLPKLPLLSATDMWEALQRTEQSRQQVASLPKESGLADQVKSVFENAALRKFGEFGFLYQFGEDVQDPQTRGGRILREFVLGRQKSSNETVVHAALYVEKWSENDGSELYFCCNTTSAEWKEKLLQRVGKYIDGEKKPNMNQGHCFLPLLVVMDIFRDNMHVLQLPAAMSDRRPPRRDTFWSIDDEEKRIREAIVEVHEEHQFAERILKCKDWSDEELEQFVSDLRQFHKSRHQNQAKKGRTDESNN